MEAITDLYSKWEQLTQRHAIPDNTSKEAFDELIKHYSSNERAYHNLTHISQLLQTAEEFKNQLEDYDAVCFAIWFHDVIYNTSAGNNEELSAAYAEGKLISFHLSFNKVNAVRTMILATRNHIKCNPESNSDLAYFLDFDLKILGSSLEDYIHYSNQIRKEYHSIPNFLYRPGRKKVLTGFLNVERLYKTDIFFQRYEKQARTNIQTEIAQL